MPESPIRALPAACQQKGRKGYRRWTRSTRLRGHCTPHWLSTRRLRVP